MLGSQGKVPSPSEVVLGWSSTSLSSLSGSLPLPRVFFLAEHNRHVYTLRIKMWRMYAHSTVNTHTFIITCIFCTCMYKRTLQLYAPIYVGRVYCAHIPFDLFSFLQFVCSRAGPFPSSQGHLRGPLLLRFLRGWGLDGTDVEHRLVHLERAI